MVLALKAFKAISLLAPPSRRRAAWDAADRARRIADLRAPVPVALRLALAPRLRVLCYPAVPSHNQLLYKLCAASGFLIHGDAETPYDAAAHTMKTRGGCSLGQEVPVINRACVDVSKSRVAAVFEKTFDYALAVDPTRHEGPIVEKSEDNSAHDGRILPGPLDREAIRPGRVYQRLVDATEGERAVDLRTPVIGGTIPVVIEKRRPLARRFENYQDDLRVHDPAMIYSLQERTDLLRLAAQLGLDFGEMDVLRDRDGRLFVVDVNNRPAGPAKELRPDLKRRAFDAMLPCFRALFP